MSSSWRSWSAAWYEDVGYNAANGEALLMKHHWQKPDVTGSHRKHTLLWQFCSACVWLDSQGRAGWWHKELLKPATGEVTKDLPVRQGNTARTQRYFTSNGLQAKPADPNQGQAQVWVELSWQLKSTGLGAVNPPLSRVPATAYCLELTELLPSLGTWAAANPWEPWRSSAPANDAQNQLCSQAQTCRTTRDKHSLFLFVYFSTHGRVRSCLTRCEDRRVNSAFNCNFTAFLGTWQRGEKETGHTQKGETGREPTRLRGQVHVLYNPLHLQELHQSLVRVMT